MVTPNVFPRTGLTDEQLKVITPIVIARWVRKLPLFQMDSKSFYGFFRSNSGLSGFSNRVNYFRGHSPKDVALLCVSSIREMDRLNGPDEDNRLMRFLSALKPQVLSQPKESLSPEAQKFFTKVPDVWWEADTK